MHTEAVTSKMCKKNENLGANWTMLKPLMQKKFISPVTAIFSPELPQNCLQPARWSHTHGHRSSNKQKKVKISLKCNLGAKLGFILPKLAKIPSHPK